ncbi:hypothetical protein [Bifidobacterium crudilactis]|jgi:hypothetical protein|uniref:hypothetical protein n=1 Tax=Bifidobacterium crudilactis TaxID=327277 RepID=UPI0023540903|nr:hypothetical protein [Bifidobacterium crudilactis]MCI2157419.1 hypothetical protein [Bifidobacterium crudilactis]
MSNQSIINDSNPELQALARTYQKDTERLERIMLLPVGYHVGFACIHGAHGSRTWELNIFHSDKTGEIDFDTPITQGTLSQVETAVHTLISSRTAYRKTIDHYSTTTVEQAQPKVREWHSRFENIERPELKLKHDPGWTCIDAGDPVGNSHFVFQTHNEQFGLDFSVLEDDTHEPSIGMLPSDWDWNVQTAEELLKLSDNTTELQQWLDDCATVTAWIRKHEGEADDHE